MRAEEIDNHLKKRPFVPFRLRMSDGEGYEVRHPEMAIVSRNVVAVAVQRSKRALPDLYWCDPIHIIRVEPLNGRRATRTRGRKE